MMDDGLWPGAKIHRRIIRSHFSCRQAGCILHLANPVSPVKTFAYLCSISDMNIKVSSAAPRQVWFLIALGHSMIFRTRRYLIISELPLAHTALNGATNHMRYDALSPSSLVHLPLPSLSRDRVMQGSPKIGHWFRETWCTFEYSCL